MIPPGARRVRGRPRDPGYHLGRYGPQIAVALVEEVMPASLPKESTQALFAAVASKRTETYPLFHRRGPGRICD